MLFGGASSRTATGAVRVECLTRDFWLCDERRGTEDVKAKESMVRLRRENG